MGEEESVCRIGVTGHRLLDDADRINDGVAQAFVLIQNAFPGRSLVVLSPLAEGADRLVAAYGLSQRIARLIVPLPLPLPSYLARFGSAASRAEFQHLSAQAEAMFELPPQPDRHQSYAAVGRYIVDQCDVLIALWDGLEPQGSGGTGEIVAYARARKKPLLIVRAVNGNRNPDDPSPTSQEEPGTVIVERLPLS